MVVHEHVYFYEFAPAAVIREGYLVSGASFQILIWSLVSLIWYLNLIKWKMKFEFYANS